MTSAAQFASFGEFLRALAMNPDDTRLKFDAAAIGLNESIGERGGYAVADQFGPEIWSRVYAQSRIIPRCDRQPMPRGGKLSVPAIQGTSNDAGSRFGGVQMFWTGEGDAPASDKLELSLINLELKKLLGLLYASDELLQDAGALEAAVRRIFGLEATFMIEDAIINGDGAGKPLGILKSEAVIKVEKESGQAADSIDPLNLVKMASRLWGPSHANAMWMMSNDVFEQVLTITAEDAFEGFVTGEEGSRRFLLQMPVELCEYTPPLGEEGDIVLADFSQYILAEKESQVLGSAHVKFTEDETAFKIRYRVDGAPAWKAPLKPKNSTVTQSPFVTLAARA